MQISINKTKMTAIIVSILMLASITLLASAPMVPSAQAQLSAQLNETREPPTGVTLRLAQPTVPYISFRRNLIGLGQTNVFNAWVSPSVETNRRYMNNITKAMMLTLQKPNGDVVELYFGNANSEGTVWLPYTVDQVGEWKVKFTFFGTYFPLQLIEETVSFGTAAGTWLQPLWMKPSETAWYSFNVQTDLVPSWPPAPLPTDYWTWPIDFSNREWWIISGAWPGTGYNAQSFKEYFDTLYPGTEPFDIPQSMFTPFVKGPDSAHILRTKLDALGGLYGGPAGTSGAFADSGYPSVVYQGRCYMTQNKLMDRTVGGTTRRQYVSCAVCFDLRTGEEYYAIPIADGGVTPTLVGYNAGTQTQSDVETFTPELLSAPTNIGNTTVPNYRQYKVNPFTGAVTNVSIGVGSGLYFNQIEEIFLSIQDLGSTLPADQRYRLINWSAVGSGSFSSKIYSNTSYARSSLPTLLDFETGYGATTAGYDIDGVRQGQNVTGYLISTGAKIWSVNVSEPQYSGVSIIGDGKVAILSMYGKYVALDLADGSIEFTTPTMNYPFGASAFSVYGASTAYGLFFRPSYDGIYAFNWTDGSIQWFTPRYAKAPFESTYVDETAGSEVYPGQTQVRIADGKVFIYDGEHSPQQPRTRGWSTYAFDVYTGKLLWEVAIGGAIMFSTPPSMGPIVDGYMYMPATNGITYIIGKGKSATTVTAPDVCVPLGTCITIQGTVLDQSPAQPNTPCVSKDSMKTQMNYIHLQYAIDGLWHNETITGVPVALSALGSDGTFYDIGTVTTNGYGGTFGKAWTPPKEDTYTIMANFAADESYGSSMGTTSVTVGPAPEPIEFPPGTEPVDNTMLLYGVLVAVIIAIIVGIVAVLLALRKH